MVMRLRLLTVFAAVSCLVFGQGGTGTISGSATDTTGAVVPGTVITAVNEQKWLHAIDHGRQRRGIHSHRPPTGNVYRHRRADGFQEILDARREAGGWPERAHRCAPGSGQSRRG